MKKLFLLLGALFTVTMSVRAQIDNPDQYNQIDPSGNITTSRDKEQVDSLGTDKEIPMALKVWTIDSRFGDRTPAVIDTVPHLFQNTIFTTGLRGEYNTTGNLGAPRINRIFIDRPAAGQFIFTQPYDFFLTPVDQFHFTNTLSPFTNISFNTAGDRTDGEDHLTAKFGVNAGKRLGMGFKFDYVYGRGYYSNQSTSHFNYTMYASYLGDRYQAHLLMSTNHQKVAENGGITNDEYITHPEIFSDNYENLEIPTVLQRNWNRNDNQHIFFTQRYSLGFNRKVKMTDDEIAARKFALEAQKDEQKREARERAERKAKENGEEFDEEAYEKQQERQQVFAGRPDAAKVMGQEPVDTTKNGAANRIQITSKAMADSLQMAEQQAREDTMWMKNEYVPVTSFIHTLDFNTYRRIYQAYDTPDNFYAYTYPLSERLGGDSIYDKTRHYSLKNTFAISLLEGFNKWAKAGIKAFISHEFRHFTLPDSAGTSSWNQQTIFVGGQLSKRQGHTLHYDVNAEFGIAGENAGDLHVDASTDLNFKLWGDTLRFVASGFFHRDQPTFYYQHYHGRHLKWDNDDLSSIIHTRIQGLLSWEKTRTHLRVAFDELKNYTYFGQNYTIDDSHNRIGNTVNVRQSGDAISLFTAQLAQDFTFGPLNWETVVTYQKSSQQDILAVPDINIYSNLYLKFKIVKQLSCELGADVRYFTRYYAPDYSPALGQYTVQENEQRVELGNYPIVNVYANFHLKHTRFFIMMSHINAGSGNKEAFLTPHYPINDRILRFGLSWNFFN